MAGYRRYAYGGSVLSWQKSLRGLERFVGTPPDCFSLTSYSELAALMADKQWYREQGIDIDTADHQTWLLQLVLKSWLHQDLASPLFGGKQFTFGCS